MKIYDTPIADLKVVESTAFVDHRGQFMRCFCEETLADSLGGRRVSQINQSLTTAVGSVRGLHFQYAPHAEMKLVRCSTGRVFDVAVDIRSGSPTFLQWFGLELSPKNQKMLVVPEGFAHGFQTLEPNSELFYLTTTAYAKSAEAGIRWNDPAINIDWPLSATDLSDRDRQHELISASFEGVTL